MIIEWSENERYFRLGDFKDYNGEPCSIQRSSLADADCIWLGRDNESFDEHGRSLGSRMHLTREMAGQLSTILLHFYITGELP